MSAVRALWDPHHLWLGLIATWSGVCRGPDSAHGLDDLRSFNPMHDCGFFPPRSHMSFIHESARDRKLCCMCRAGRQWFLQAGVPAGLVASTSGVSLMHQLSRIHRSRRAMLLAGKRGGANRCDRFLPWFLVLSQDFGKRSSLTQRSMRSIKSADAD